MPFAIVLDVDGTIVPGDRRALRSLADFAEQNGGEVFVNTARSPAYCALPDERTTSLAPRENHYCQRYGRSVPESKVLNMEAVSASRGIDPSCVALVDDLSSNVSAVREAGFLGHEVDGRVGVTASDADAVRRSLSRCL